MPMWFWVGLALLIVAITIWTYVEWWIAMRKLRKGGR